MKNISFLLLLELLLQDFFLNFKSELINVINFFIEKSARIFTMLNNYESFLTDNEVNLLLRKTNNELIVR